ncbi:MAG: hypothetical protein ACRCR9_02990, partial [Chitinophagaceae bacterium]
IEKNMSDKIVLPKTIAYHIYIRIENYTLYGVAYKANEKNVLSKIFVKGKYDSIKQVVTLNEFRILENPLGNDCLFTMNLQVEEDRLKGAYFTMGASLVDNFCNEGYMYLEKEKTYNLSDNLFAKILKTPSNVNRAKQKVKKLTIEPENPQLSLTYFEAQSNTLTTTSIDIQNSYTVLRRRPQLNISNIELKDSLIHISLQSRNNLDTFSIFQGNIIIAPKVIFSKTFNMWIILNSTFNAENIALVNLSKKSPSTVPITIELTIDKEKKIIPIVVDSNNIYKLNFSLKKTP